MLCAVLKTPIFGTKLAIFVRYSTDKRPIYGSFVRLCSRQGMFLESSCPGAESPARKIRQSHGNSEKSLGIVLSLSL